jgi:hypothetical protein
MMMETLSNLLDQKFFPDRLYTNDGEEWMRVHIHHLQANSLLTVWLC